MIEVLLLVGAMQKSVDLKPGDRLAVKVEDISTTGYRWQLDPPDAAVLDYEGTSLVPGTAPGAAGLRSFVFEARGRGRAAITLTLRRPWEDPAAPPLREGKVEVAVGP